MVEAGWVPIDSSCRDAQTDLADARSHTSVLHHCSRAPYQECLVPFLRAFILAAPRDSGRVLPVKRPVRIIKRRAWPHQYPLQRRGLSC